MKIFKYCFVVVLTLLLGSAAFAKGADSIYVSEDSSSIEKQGLPEFVELTKSPSGALWRSFVLPGWGQVYNEDYIKAPVFTVAWGAIGWFIYDNHKKYIDFKKQTDAVGQDSPDYSALRQEREFYRDNRDRLALYLLGVYGIAAVDAYTGAHLFDFEVGDDLSCKIKPVPIGVLLQIEF